SGLARATVELLPRERFSNFSQATLFNTGDPRLVHGRYRTVHALEPNLSDVRPALVADLVVSVIDSLDRLPGLMAGPAAGAGEGPVALVRGEPPRPLPEPPLPLPDRAREAAARAVAPLRRRRAPREPRHDGSLPAELTDARG